MAKVKGYPLPRKYQPKPTDIDWTEQYSGSVGNLVRLVNAGTVKLPPNKGVIIYSKRKKQYYSLGASKRWRQQQYFSPKKKKKEKVLRYEGFLWKRSLKWMRNWKKRLFILDTSTRMLEWRRHDILQESILITPSTKVFTQEVFTREEEKAVGKRPNCFKLQFNRSDVKFSKNPRKPNQLEDMYLQASNEAEALAWVRALEQVINAANETYDRKTSSMDGEKMLEMDLKYLDQPAQSSAGRSTNELDLSPYLHKRSNAGLPLNFVESKASSPSTANLRPPQYSGSSRVSNFSNLKVKLPRESRSDDAVITTKIDVPPPPPTPEAELAAWQKKFRQSLPKKVPRQSLLLPPEFSESSDDDSLPPPPTPMNGVAGLATRQKKLRKGLPKKVPRQSLLLPPEFSENSDDDVPPPPPTPQQNKKKKGSIDIAAKRAIIYEIFATEKRYANDLRAAQNLWMTPMLDGSMHKNIERSDVDAIFSNLDTITELSIKFCSELERAIPSSICVESDPLVVDRVSWTVADLVLKFAPFFLLYKTYTSNHPNAENTLDRLKQHEGCNEAIIAPVEPNMGNAQGIGNSRGLGLESFLIMPVQRIAMYTLLLGRLAKLTNKSREDFEAVTMARDKVLAVASMINVGLEDKSKMRSSHNLLSMRASNPHLLTPHPDVTPKQEESYDDQYDDQSRSPPKMSVSRSTGHVRVQRNVAKVRLLAKAIRKTKSVLPLLTVRTRSKVARKSSTQSMKSSVSAGSTNSEGQRVFSHAFAH